jgi:outer membrane protein assembly factor BamA
MEPRRLAMLIGMVGFFLGLAASHAWADVDQEDTTASFTFVVDTIIVQGALVTKPFIIFREMTIQTGDTVTWEQIEEDQKNIENLNLFARVEIIPRVIANRNELIVIVTEEWYILPLPFWRKEEGDFSKITYGFEYLQKNFRGRNERISAKIWVGEETGYQASYSNPWFTNRGNWGCNIDVFQITRGVDNEKYRKLGADIKTTGWRTSVQRRFGFDTRVTVGVGLTRYRSEYSDLMVAGNGHDDWTSLNIGFLTDGRDLIEYPSEGWYRQLYVSWSLLLNQPSSLNEISMVSGSVDIRHYHTLIGDFIACQRGLISLSEGLVPLYRRYFLGANTSTKVRGWRGDTEEGEGLFLGSLGIRHHIFPVRYFTWKSAPILKRYFRDLKYGLSAGLFLDFGQVWIRPGEATNKRFQTGYGVGLHFHLPYLDVLRVDAGWSPESRFQDAEITVRNQVAF